MNEWVILFFFFEQRLQLVILSYHLKILFSYSLPLLSSLSSFPLQSACLFKASSSTAQSQEGGVGRSTHWHDPINELCHHDDAGALEGLLCNAGIKCIVKHRMHLALELSRYRASTAFWISVGTDKSHELRVWFVVPKCLQDGQLCMLPRPGIENEGLGGACSPHKSCCRKSQTNLFHPSIHPSMNPSIHPCGWRAVILFTSVFCGKVNAL